MEHFDPKVIDLVPEPNYEGGTVDINYNFKQKSSDQVKLSLDWGQMDAIGHVGLKLNDFSMVNLFHRNHGHHGTMPISNGETPSLGAQASGTYH